jgi:hypothetical protein
LPELVEVEGHRSERIEKKIGEPSRNCMRHLYESRLVAIFLCFSTYPSKTSAETQ